MRFSHKNSHRIEFFFYACYIFLPSVSFFYRLLAYEQIILSAVYINQRRIIQLFVNNKVEVIWIKGYVIYIMPFSFRENHSTVRFSGFWTDVPAWVLTNTKSEHTNRYFSFLIFDFTALNSINWTERTETITKVKQSRLKE